MRTKSTLEECRRAARAVLGGSEEERRVSDAAIYLAHMIGGIPMRWLAAHLDCQPSTVMRAVRRVEQRREDPLMDALFDEIEARLHDGDGAQDLSRETALTKTRTDAHDDAQIEREARRILRRMCEPGAFLALARGADTACVFRRGDDGLVTLARAPVSAVRAFAAREWISCGSASANMARYDVTSVGRAWLKRTLAEDGDARRRRSEARGMAEAASPFARQHQEEGERLFQEDGRQVSRRVNLGETPLGWLAKRRAADGSPFLTPAEVAAGEKLREDFEQAQIGPRVAQDWRRFLTPGESGGVSRLRGPAEGPMGARDRVSRALEALGPGLNDAALRACCFLEGLEATERRMGWSARSGKVVLKIALTRLAEHYGFAAKRNALEREPLRKAV